MSGSRRPQRRFLEPHVSTNCWSVPDKSKNSRVGTSRDCPQAQKEGISTSQLIPTASSTPTARIPCFPRRVKFVSKRSRGWTRCRWEFGQSTFSQRLDKTASGSRSCGLGQIWTGTYFLNFLHLGLGIPPLHSVSFFKNGIGFRVGSWELGIQWLDHGRINDLRSAAPIRSSSTDVLFLFGQWTHQFVDIVSRINNQMQATASQSPSAATAPATPSSSKHHLQSSTGAVNGNQSNPVKV